MPDNKPLIQSVAIWLKENANDIYNSLNPGTENSPPKWPEKLREYYRIYNGQKKNSDFLFPKRGNWLSIEDAAIARTIWLEEYDFDWYKESYFPIVGCLEQMDSATVIDIETGRIGDVDIELQEFTLLVNDVDELFSDLLHTLTTDGYPPVIEYKTYSEAEIDHFEYLEALEVEEENRHLDDSPSSEQLFAWGKKIFRKMGDYHLSRPNLHFMRLAKKYFDQIPLSDLSKSQAREIAFFNLRYRQIINDV
jgi:hypothetical protein